MLICSNHDLPEVREQVYRVTYLLPSHLPSFSEHLRFTYCLGPNSRNEFECDDRLVVSIQGFEFGKTSQSNPEDQTVQGPVTLRPLWGTGPG